MIILTWSGVYFPTKYSEIPADKDYCPFLVSKFIASKANFL
jgi:hypothetical protein